MSDITLEGEDGQPIHVEPDAVEGVSMDLSHITIRLTNRSLHVPATPMNVMLVAAWYRHVALDVPTIH
ncbi:hypothetical protein [Paraburkholderia tropica]|uniref:hypothetical protein n=1 Tax=Paraburkholderia tropica TaxID=92647 RepID=UPI003D2D2B14